MADPQDRVDIPGVRNPAQVDASRKAIRGGRAFLSVWFSCCHVYARIYRNTAGTMYEGGCPRCGSRVRARVGPGGTSQRIFRAG